MLRHSRGRDRLDLAESKRQTGLVCVQPALLSSPARVKTSALCVALCILAVERMLDKELSTQVKNLNDFTK